MDQLNELEHQEETQDNIIDEQQEDLSLNQEAVSEPIVQEPAKPTKQELNFSALRKEKEAIEKAHADALRKLQEYESRTNQPEEDLEINIGDDEFFEGKHYKKLQRILKNQREALEKQQQQIHAATIESKLRLQYQDFDKVLTADNIKLLRDNEPEIADTIASTNDIYTKAVSAYKMIKKLGIYVDDAYDKEREIAKNNSLKPRPLASVSPQQGDSPLSRANAFADGLTTERKAQLWKEMQEASKGY